MADVNSNLDNWSATAASNSPSGATNIGTGLDDNLRQIQATVREYLATKGADIASAATTDLSIATGNRVDITGTVTITAFGTLTAGMWKILRFTGALTLTHNGISLQLPGSANITTAAGDFCMATSLGSGNWEVNWYQPKSGLPVSGAPFIDSTAIIRGSADATKLLRFEVDGFTAGNTRVITPPDANYSIVAYGANGTVLMPRSQVTAGAAYVAALNKYIYGLIYANNAGDATNDLDISAGGAMDSTGAYFMVGSALTKQSDVAWAVGTGVGGLDTGAVGNSDYYIWLIARSDTGVVDYLFSLSSTAPTMPTNYDFKRLIGWFKRVGGTIVAFTTYETEGGGLELLWSSPTLDINLSNTLTTSRRTDAVKVPLNFSVIAHLNVDILDAAGHAAWVYCPDQTDLAPSTTVAPLANASATAAVNSSNQMRIRTSSAGLIAARSTVATTDFYGVVTVGFTWARKN